MRSNFANDGDDSKAEASLRKEKSGGPNYWQIRPSSIIIHGEELAVGTNASQVIYSSARDIVPSTGKFAHSRISLH